MLRNSLLVTAVAVGFAVSVASFSLGTLPGVNVTLTIARQAPSCGGCHFGTAGANNLNVRVVPAERSLVPGQSIQVVTSASGGAIGTNAGFVMEATAGQFSAGNNSRTTAAANFISHSTKLSNRQWSYVYTAPQTAGLIELYTVVNTVDGTGARTNDIWGFYHVDATQSLSTPVRLFANAAGNLPFGHGCVGSFGNHPVLGASQSPTIGNAAYGLQLVGAAPASQAVVLFGFRFATPLDLTLIGVSGCSLLVNSFASLQGTTSAGNAQRGDGVLTLPFPIPQNPSLMGIVIDTQGVIIDQSNGRTLPVTLTNGLSMTLT